MSLDATRTIGRDGALRAAPLGVLADYTSLDFVFRVCSILPAIGILMAFMPKQETPRPAI